MLVVTRWRRAANACATAAVLFATAAPVRAERLPVRHYTLADGLPHNSITALHQDRHGFLWVGTSEGLARYDGYRFVTYGVESGLPHPAVSDIGEDPAGQLWVATSGGVSRLREEPGAPASAAFVSYTVGDGSRSVNGLAFSADGTVWCATYAGLFRARPARSSPPTFEIVSAYRDTEVADVLVDPAGRVWVWVLNRGLERADGNRPARYEAESRAARRGWFMRGFDDRVWLVTESSLFEIETTAPADGRSPWRRVPDTYPGTLATMSGKRGARWIAATDGLRRVADSGNPRSSPVHVADARLNRVLLVDRSGHAWVGSETNGLYQVIDGPIVTYTVADGLPAPAVDSVFEGSGGRIFAHVRNAGIVEIAGSRLTRLAGSERVQREGWPRWPVRTAAGDWWLVRPEGLCRIGGPIPVFDRPAACVSGHESTPVAASDTMDVPAVVEDRDGRLWFSTRSGVYRYDPARRVLERSLVTFSPATAIAVPALMDAGGAIWFFANEEMGRLSNGRIDRFVPGPGLPEIRPRSVMMDRAGRLWVGMRNTGVAMTADPTAPQPVFVNYSTREGLSSHSVWSIAEDEAGRIYFGTGRGLDRLDPVSGQIRRFTTEDGLAGDLINKCFRDSRGDIWVATPTGLSRLDPRVELSPGPPPATRLHRVTLSGDDVALPERGTDRLSGLHLTSSGSTLVVEYGAISLAGPRALRYQYRLAAGDTDWSAPSDQRSVTFARLAPGQYAFAVRAVTRDGGTGEAAHLTFIIPRPIWQRWWFIGLLAVAVSAAGVGLHRLRVRRLLALDRIRRQIALDLHDDVGAGLVQVAILSEVAKRGVPSAQAPLLDEIASLARSMREAMSDIVWSIDPRTPGMSDLVRRMEHAAHNALGGAGVRVDFRTPSVESLDRVALPSDRRRHLLLILKEAVANVARHASASRVEIDLRRSGRELVLSVRDDGRGFDPAGVRDGQGLQNLGRRAEALGGQLTIDAASGRGTTVEVRIPL